MPTQLITNCIVLALALTCFASFTWSISRFFRRDRSMPTRMRILSASGLLGMILQCAGIVTITKADPLRLCIAMAAYILSLTVFWWALATTWSIRLPIAFTLRIPEYIIRDGPYQLVRHPIYSAYLLAWSAGALAIAAWWPWLIVIAMAVQYFIAIRHEEREFLTSSIANAYQQYRETRGMLLPNPLKLLLANIGSPL
jgi:protein-S-isoprenylcysteine O-methyltransferase Ste14